MTTAAPAPEDPKKGGSHFNPEEYRMSVGDHLEELRSRLFKGIIGFVLAAAICFILGTNVIMPFFLKPLLNAQIKNNLPPGVYYHEAAEAFMAYLEVSLISAATLASPWLLYQLWQFIAAGLYPAERKYVTKYLPLSIILLLGGMVFLYVYVLPVSVEFFLKFGSDIPLTVTPAYVAPGRIPATTQPALILPHYNGDPPAPLAEGQIWLDLAQNRVKLFLHDETRVINLSPPNAASPMITMSEYIDMVVGMLLAFGISFQLPLVVLALNKIGILEISTLKSLRRYVYFGMSIISACIIPDVVTGMVALMVPLILLYELGIFLAWWSQRKQPKEA
ncbi:MAG TPA: twin-arginine translocase subunit TatC [Tepidisphaeraceae bacterium]|nr:twin-arginine translocase subunit TatC [Tepidisphaeraceae bacterium]